MRGLNFGILLFIFFVMLSIGQITQEYHAENNMTVDIYNYTETNLVWNYNVSQEELNNTDLNYSQIQTRRISNVINKGVDFFGFVAFEASKWCIEFGYTHPDYDFEYFMYFIKYWLFAIIIIAALPVVVPLLALIYLVGVGVKKVVIKLSKHGRVRKRKR